MCFWKSKMNNKNTLVVKMHRKIDQFFAKMSTEIVLTEQTNGAIIKT